MKQKKNRKGGLLLAAALLLTCAAAGTVAKYQTTLSGSSTIQVAKFDVSASNLDKAQTATLGLFDSIKDTGLNEENDVASGKIAPGTSGYKEIELTNKSEVNVKAVMTAVVSDHSISTGESLPIELAISESATPPTELSDWANPDTTKTIDSINYASDAAGTKKKMYLHWRWVYSLNSNQDKADTAIGEAKDASFSPKVTLSVEFTQID